MGQNKLLAIGIFALLSLFVASPLFAQEDAIEKRQELMKSNSAASKDLKLAVAKGDYATVEAKAKIIIANMDKVLKLFPKGSTSDKSRAKPDIWEKWDDFSKNPAKVKAAAQALVDAAKSKDEAQVGVNFRDLGAACGNCHKSFRGPRR